MAKSKKTGKKQATSYRQGQHPNTKASLAKNGQKTTFKADPSRINKQGRPRKFIWQLIEEKRKEGYDFKPSHVADVAWVLLHGTEDELKAMLADPVTAYTVRVTIRQLNGPRGFDVVRELWDRCAGRAKQFVETNAVPVINIESASEETRKIMLEVRAKMAEIDKEFEDKNNPATGTVEKPT